MNPINALRLKIALADPKTAPATKTVVNQEPVDLVEFHGGSRRALRAGAKTFAKSALLPGVVLAGLSIAMPVTTLAMLTACGLGASLFVGRETYLNEVAARPRLGRKFAESLRVRVSRELEGRGVKPNFSRGRLTLTRAGRMRETQRRLAETVTLACRHLGPAATLSLASELAAAGYDADAAREMGRLNDRQLLRSIEGIPVYKEPYNRPGSAGIDGAIYIDERKLSNPATRDFVIGHEMGHVKALDSWKFHSHDTLISAVGGPGSANPVSRQLRAESAEIRWEAELRADREGLLWAQAQGHQTEEIAKGFQDLLVEERAEKGSQTHPPLWLRLNLIRGEGESLAP